MRGDGRRGCCADHQAISLGMGPGESTLSARTGPVQRVVILHAAGMSALSPEGGRAAVVKIPTNRSP